MFRVAAGMGWVEDLPPLRPDGTLDYPVVAFICSFIAVVNWTLLQVFRLVC